MHLCKSLFIYCLCVLCRELTPIEQASRLNQKLKANYEARLARLTPGQAYQKTSLVGQSVVFVTITVYVHATDGVQRQLEAARGCSIVPFCFLSCFADYH